ncbi:MAG TPA: hypothetical protein PLD10_18575 [Rhodopila sp.]|nr:hypothetical protein [Rhodopila sp.]
MRQGKTGVAIDPVFRLNADLTGARRVGGRLSRAGCAIVGSGGWKRM